MGVWQLFVDESGSFDPGARGVVAGLLVQGPDTEATRSSLRALLEGALPELPWPPHASTMNVAGAWAGFAMRVGRASALAARCEAAVSALSTVHPIAATDAARREVVERLRRAASGASRRWTPPDRDLRDAMVDADRWLAKNALRARGALCAIRDEAERRRVEAQRDVARRVGASAVALVAAWGRGAELDALTAGTDGYLMRLVALVERAVAALKLFDDSARHTLLLYVATRDVRAAGEPPRAMTRQHLNRVIALVEGPPVDPRRTVDVVPMPPQRFDERAHPGIVIADHLANRLNAELAGAGGEGWSYVETRADDATGVACVLPGRGDLLPLIAMDGAFRDVIRAHWKDRALAPAPPGPPWAAEQAARWIRLT